jgi:hypothetical protein
MIWLLLGLASAHPLAPSVLRLSETETTVEAVFRTPRVRVAGTEVTPVLPCEVSSGPASRGIEGAVETRWTLACSSLVGRTAGVDGLEQAGTNALIDVRTSAGTDTVLLAGAQARYTIPPARRVGAVAADHLWLGFWHLLEGFDHLLFVLGLVVLVPVRRLVHAVTAFTLGHGCSLAAATLGFVSVPQGPVEVLIALSLMVVAAEVLRGGESVLGRFPWLVCVPFGLLHGLGFASALAATGLTGGSVLGALLGFNVGIELAQLGVVGLALAAGRLVGKPRGRVLAAAGWAGGGLAAMWVIERVVAVVRVGLG